MQDFNIIVVIGATASGKTRLGVEIAKQYQGEIISADSRQVYKGLDIGSGKDLDEYGDTPYHLIDIIEPDKEYNVFQFQQDFTKAYTDITLRNKLPILVGGTGLYIDSVVNSYEFVQVDKDFTLRDKLAKQSLEEVQRLLKQLDEAVYNKIDITVRPRLYRAIEVARSKNNKADKPSLKTELAKLKPLYFGIKWDRKVLRKRITQRLKHRLENGMIEEVQGLLSQGLSHKEIEYFGLEYRFVSQYLAEEISFDEMFELLNIAIHKYAKRQDTWFRKIERQGGKVHWLDGTKDTVLQAKQILKNT